MIDDHCRGMAISVSSSAVIISNSLALQSSLSNSPEFEDFTSSQVRFVAAVIDAAVLSKRNLIARRPLAFLEIGQLF